jgi:maltose O-acetyltransferase
VNRVGGIPLDLLQSMVDAIGRYRTRRRWATLQRLGMEIGRNVDLPASTWIDRDFCYLISIGDNCSFGEGCLILAHDAQMDEFLDAGRLGRVVIGADCHIGARTTILPGVGIGPRTVVAPHAVVLRSLPPDSYCSGNPARMVSTLDDFLSRHRADMGTLPRYSREDLELLRTSAAGRARLLSTLSQGGYVTGSASTSGRAQ